MHWSNLIKSRQCWKTKTRHSCPLALPCASFFTHTHTYTHFNYSSFPDLCAAEEMTSSTPGLEFFHERCRSGFLLRSSHWMRRVNSRSLRVCSKPHTNMHTVTGLIDKCETDWHAGIKIAWLFACIQPALFSPSACVVFRSQFDRQLPNSHSSLSHYRFLPCLSEWT